MPEEQWFPREHAKMQVPGPCAVDHRARGKVTVLVIHESHVLAPYVNCSMSPTFASMFSEAVASGALRLSGTTYLEIANDFSVIVSHSSIVDVPVVRTRDLKVLKPSRGKRPF